MRITSGVTIERPAEEVFAFIADPENNPRWQRGMVACRVTSPPPLGVGSTYEQEARFLGRTIRSTFEIVAYEEGRMIRGTATAGSFPITFTRRTEPAGEGTRVTAVVEGDASGFFRIAAPVLRRMVLASVDADYRRLAEVLGPKG